MSIQLRFLGTGDAFGSGGRLQACILVDWNGYRALLDCGASSLAAMRRFDVDPNAIDAVLISHLHGDHFGGIPFVLLDAYYGGRTKPLRIAGPPDLEARSRAANDVLFRGFAPRRLHYELEWVPLSEGSETAVGPLVVTGFAVDHVIDVSPLALRVRCGDRVLAYSGDAKWCEGLVRAASGSDLFVCEASEFAAKSGAHISYRTLMDHRAELDCKRIVLTHLGKETLGHVGELELEHAEDGMTIAL